MTEKIMPENDVKLIKNIRNSDEDLNSEASHIIAERKPLGLQGLVGGLQAIIINTEPERQRATAEELLRYTGLDYCEAFEDEKYKTCLLKTPGFSEFLSADFLIRSRAKGENPFDQFNSALKFRHLSNTRLETFVFETVDIEKYVSIQKSQGTKFLTDEIVCEDDYSFIQTKPSRFTGNSLGFIQWSGERGCYETSGSKPLDLDLKKPEHDPLRTLDG